MWPSLTNCLHYLIEQKKKKNPLKFHSVPIEKPLDKMFLLFCFFLIKDIVVYLREH